MTIFSKCPLSVATTCLNQSTKLPATFIKVFISILTHWLLSILHLVGNHGRFFSLHYFFHVVSWEEISWTEIWRIGWPGHTLSRFVVVIQCNDTIISKIFPKENKTSDFEWIMRGINPVFPLPRNSAHASNVATLCCSGIFWWNVEQQTRVN